MTRFIHIWLTLGLGLLAVHLPACNVGSNAVAVVSPTPSAAVTQAAAEAVASGVHADELVADGNVEMYY